MVSSKSFPLASLINDSYILVYRQLSYLSIRNAMNILVEMLISPPF